MASRMDNKQQGCCNKTIFSIRVEQTRDKTNTNREASSRADGHGKTSAYLYRSNLRDDARCICGHNETNHGSSPIALREDKHTATGPKTPNKSTTKLDGN